MARRRRTKNTHIPKEACTTLRMRRVRPESGPMLPHFHFCRPRPKWHFGWGASEGVRGGWVVSLVGRYAFLRLGNSLIYHGVGDRCPQAWQHLQASTACGRNHSKRGEMAKSREYCQSRFKYDTARQNFIEITQVGPDSSDIDYNGLPSSASPGFFRPNKFGSEFDR